MNILHVSSTDQIGKRFNGQYLTENMSNFGHKASHLVWRKEGDNEDTFQMLNYPMSRKIQRVSEILEGRLSIRSILHPSTFFLSKNKQFEMADVCHYHLVSWPSYFSILAFPYLTRLKPSVWTIHDLWPITGHCVQPFDCTRWESGCGRCPYLHSDFSMRKDRTSEMWKVKDFVYKHSQFDLIVASKFVQNRVEKSPLLNRFRIHHVPFGLDLNIFKPGDQDYSKQILGIDPDEIVVCFRAAPGDFKGFEHIKRALESLSTDKKVVLLTFNAKWTIESLRHKFRIIDLGWVNDDDLMLNAYNAADIFLMPSMQEAFGMMAMEAMAFGKPVVVFDGTALPEVVGGNEYGGIVIPKGDISALRDATSSLIEDADYRRFKGKLALDFARKNYSLELHVNKLLNVYAVAQEQFNKKRN